jgi:rhodanese-related sulfurtransferase
MIKGAFWQIFGLVAWPLVPAITALCWHPELRTTIAAAIPSEVSLDEIKTWKEPVIWVDARALETYRREHIPEALPLDAQHWDEQLPRLLAAWQPGNRIVVYCDSEKCVLARGAAQRLRLVGLPNVYELRGGWLTWQQRHR